MSLAPDAHTAVSLLISGTLDPASPVTVLHLSDGRTVRVPTALLAVSPPAASAPDTMPSRSIPSVPAISGPGSAAMSPDRHVIPLVEEELAVTRRVVPTGTVRLEKTTQSFDIALDEPLAIHNWRVERVAINRAVDSAPAVREEGNTTIYPLLEEQLVLTRQLILKEEIRVSREDSERRDQQTVTLRRDHLSIHREDLG